MADNEDDTGEELGSEARGSLSARSCLAELSLARILTPSVRDDISEDRVRCAIVEVPSASWVGPVIDAAMKLLGMHVHCIDAAERPKRRSFEVDNSPSIAAGRTPIVAVSPAPDTHLHPAIIAACDRRLIVSPPDNALLSALSRACLTAPIETADLEGLTPGALDFNELCACFPVNASPELALQRLRTAIARKTGPKLEKLPTLEAAQGYGAAQRWATDLRIDLQDYRLGRIPIEEVDRGCLIYGPSGTGKSLFARIVAKACSLPIVTASVGELFATSQGDLGSVIHSLRTVFGEARQVRPSLLFLDELDALPNRSTMSNRGRDWWTPVITDFLTNLDSAMSDRGGIIVLGATNHLEQVDPALLRPGRLERSIWIGPPDPLSLSRILAHYLGDDLAGTDLLALTRARPGATGAEAEEWARAARRRARRAGRPMTLQDLEDVVLPPDPRSPAEKKRAAAHEAGHALASLLLNVDTVESVTIQRSEKSGGHTAFVRRVPDFSTKSDIDDRVIVLLAGRAAEDIILGDVSSAAGGDAASDLALATNLVTLAHTALGLGPHITWRGLPDQTLTMSLADLSLRAAVNDELARLLERATVMLRANSSRLALIADAVEKRITISGDDLRALASSMDHQPGRRTRSSRGTKPVLDPGA